MPIQIQCSCGKRLQVKEQFAGKAVKCPGCGAAIQVPGGGAAAAPMAAQPMPQQAPAPTQSALGNLFDEEGFETNVNSACPACGATMAPNAVLCTKCGYNRATGERVGGHQVAGVDVPMSVLALQRAEANMKSDDEMQRRMTSGAGLPWWGLSLILFIMFSGAGLGVITVMQVTDETGSMGGFNALATFFGLSGTACALVAFGAWVKLIIEGFKIDTTKGFLCMTLFYLFVFVFEKPKGRIGPLVILIIMAAAAGGLFFQSNRV